MLFANAGIAGFAFLAKAAAAAGATPRARMLLLVLVRPGARPGGAGAAKRFSAAAGRRGRLGLIAGQAESARHRWRYGLGLLAASLVIMAGANFALGFRSDHGQGAIPTSCAWRKPMTWLAPFVWILPSILTVLEKQAPTLDTAIRKDGVALYSPHLVDTLENSSVLTHAIYHAPPGAVFAQWRHLVLSHPGLYLRERLAGLPLGGGAARLALSVIPMSWAWMDRPT